MSPLFACKISRSGNSYDYSKWTTAFLFSLYVTFLCAHSVLKGLFVRLVMPIYKAKRLRRPSSLVFFWMLLIIIIMVRRMFVQTGLVQQSSFRHRFRAIFCKFGEFRKCRCCVLVIYRINYIIHLGEIQTKYKWCKFIGHFSKIFGCF